MVSPVGGVGFRPAKLAGPKTIQNLTSELENEKFIWKK
jgi:hypothetical protein